MIFDQNEQWEKNGTYKGLDKCFDLPIARSDSTLSAQSVHCWPENSDGLSSRVAIFFLVAFCQSEIKRTWRHVREMPVADLAYD